MDRVEIWQECSFGEPFLNHLYGIPVIVFVTLNLKILPFPHSMPVLCFFFIFTFEYVPLYYINSRGSEGKWNGNFLCGEPFEYRAEGQTVWTNHMWSVWCGVPFLLSLGETHSQTFRYWFSGLVKIDLKTNKCLLITCHLITSNRKKRFDWLKRLILLIISCQV